ncbi:MAG: cyclase family protein [Chloroflexi bacterium]|nr:cyclase family protein [Chloroflexota bacterium]
MLYDITRTLTLRSAAFPGDTRVSLVPVAEITRGASVNVTAITCSSHAGTHVDAPRHYSSDGVGIDQVSLDVLIGPCRVLTIDEPGDLLLATLQARLSGAPPPARLLLHTRASAVPDDLWDDGFAAIEPAAAEWLGALGVRLIGVDAPSVDPADSKTLPAHKAFLHSGVTIMENLQLTGVPDGEYELIALPLRIAGIDAAPARVVLRISDFRF